MIRRAGDTLEIRPLGGAFVCIMVGPQGVPREAFVASGPAELARKVQEWASPESRASVSAPLRLVVSGPMDARSFLEKHGKAVASTVAERAGTNYAYFSQLAYGHRRPSVDLARTLILASETQFPDSPDDWLDLDSLLPPRKPAQEGATA